MLSQIRDLPGEMLDTDSYRKDFRAHWSEIEDFFWKLERIQTFREVGKPDWATWVAGNWEHALALFEADRERLVEYFARVRSRGVEARRVRVIEYPISPYLQWELNAFKVQAEAGECIRVLDAAKLGEWEASATLPEVTILGTRVMYEVVYDDTGTVRGGRKLQVGQDVIQACRSEMAQLYEQGEAFLPFFEREVAPLPTPVADRI